MRWFDCNKEDLIGLERINPKTNKHILRLSPNANTVLNIIEEDQKKQGDTRFLVEYSTNPTIAEIKNILLSLQKEYDSSREVNQIIINDKVIWFDKATRIGIVNMLNFEKQDNKTTTDIWFGNDRINVEIDKALDIFKTIEIYAKQCYDNTQNHYTEINELTSIEDCLAYDITAGYPNILNIKI